MVDYSDTELGRATQYTDGLDADLLYPIARSKTRRCSATLILPFVGGDQWTAYELSWLGPGGLPQIAIAEFWVSCESHNIVESKSLKLYLNSYNQHMMATWTAVEERLRADLSAATGIAVEVTLYHLDEYPLQCPMVEPHGYCLDQRQVAIDTYTPEAGLLGVDGAREVEEILYSHLLRSNCPVTNQPDWASVYISYRGAPINRDGLLAYLVSYRQHQDFHEQCVEQIFNDIIAYCQPHELSVYARYLRRGGIDINPFRSNHQPRPVIFRHVRQ